MITIFTHIPKTSGTSFIENLVLPNIDAQKLYQYRGLKSFLDKGFLDKDSFILGHEAYGLHYFLPGVQTQYITWLRDPIERAISFYYFIQGSDPSKYRHPMRIYAERLSLSDFYKESQFQNWQTRYLAGMAYDRTYAYIPESARRNLVLAAALKHLEESYACVGFLERLEESWTHFEQTFAWQKRANTGVHKSARNRPARAEVDQATLEALHKYNSLDIELYNIALAQFDKKTSGSR